MSSASSTLFLRPKTSIVTSGSCKTRSNDCNRVPSFDELVKKGGWLAEVKAHGASDQLRAKQTFILDFRSKVRNGLAAPPLRKNVKNPHHAIRVNLPHIRPSRGVELCRAVQEVLHAAAGRPQHVVLVRIQRTLPEVVEAY